MHCGSVPLARKNCHGQLILLKEVIKNGTSNMKTEFVALVLFANVTNAIQMKMQRRSRKYGHIFVDYVRRICPKKISLPRCGTTNTYWNEVLVVKIAVDRGAQTSYARHANSVATRLAISSIVQSDQKSASQAISKNSGGA